MAAEAIWCVVNKAWDGFFLQHQQDSFSCTASCCTVLDEQPNGIFYERSFQCHVVAALRKSKEERIGQHVHFYPINSTLSCIQTGVQCGVDVIQNILQYDVNTAT